MKLMLAELRWKKFKNLLKHKLDIQWFCGKITE